MSIDQSYDINGVLQVDYCTKCFETDLDKDGNPRDPKEGLVNGRIGKFCSLGCN